MLKQYSSIAVWKSLVKSNPFSYFEVNTIKYRSITEKAQWRESLYFFEVSTNFFYSKWEYLPSMT